MASVTIGTHCEDADFTVVAEKGQVLLGRDTAIKLGVLKIGKDLNINTVQNMTYSHNTQMCFTDWGN